MPGVTPPKAKSVPTPFVPYSSIDSEFDTKTFWARLVAGVATMSKLRPNEAMLAASSYLKTAWKTSDLLDNRYRVSTVGTNQIKISNRTKQKLTGVGIDWGHY
jgi:hypothetical protein